MSNLKIHVVAAHPDDELLGLAGTLVKHSLAGDIISIHILSDGLSSRFSELSEKELAQEIKKRMTSAVKSAEVLGAKSLTISHYPDQKLDTVPLIDIVKTIENTVYEIDPDIVYIHHRGDVNKDHRIAFEACLTAFRPTGKHFPKKLLCYETFSSTEWGAPFAESAFIPNYFVDISETFEKKIECLNYYPQELRQEPHPRSVRLIEISARKWGSLINCKYAEAFMLVREIG